MEKVKCEACGRLYDYVDEPQEVKEGGIHICPECWDRDDGAEDSE